jgi:S-formylglutathione hydrolase FrmB
MKRLLASVSLALALAFPALAQPLSGSVIRTETLHSLTLNENVNVNIYLPAGYDQNADKTYPVVYLLHGLTDTYTAWAVQGHMKDVVDELILSGEAARMVIIMPNAGDPDARNVWNGYFNQPGHRYEDFFFGELMPELEARFHIRGDKQHRAIMGLSMGGGGSTVYCQRHPDVFSSCYAMSPWLDNEEPWSDNPEDKLYKVCQSVHEHSAIDFVEKADEATLQKLRTVKWFIDCGDDDFLLDLSLRFYQQMRSRGVKAELRVRDGWHGWEYWHLALRMALPFASRNFGHPEAL